MQGRVRKKKSTKGEQVERAGGRAVVGCMTSGKECPEGQREEMKRGGGGGARQENQLPPLSLMLCPLKC